jgi:hypothetical protein
MWTFLRYDEAKRHTSGSPNSSTNTRFAKGPPAPCIPSNSIENFGWDDKNARSASKSKHSLRIETYSVYGSIIVTVDEPRTYVVPTGALISMLTESDNVLNDWIAKLRSYNF